MKRRPLFSPTRRPTVLDIRGTHGSGKSYIIRTLLGMAEWTPIVGEGKVSVKGPIRERQLGHECKEWSAAIVGVYADGFATGGCDNIKLPEETTRRVKLFCNTYKYVLLEGVLVSHTFGRYERFVRANPWIDYKFLYLDTPMDLCLKRARERNADSNARYKTATDKIGVNVIKDYKQIWVNVRGKMKKAGLDVTVLDHTDPMPAILAIMGVCRAEA